MTATIKCKVVADKVWHSKENRMLHAGDIVEFPAQVKNHEGKLVDFKVGESFEIAKDEKPGKPAAKTDGKAAGDGKPAGDGKAADSDLA